MHDVRVVVQGVGGQTLQAGMEFRNPILGKKSDQVEPAQRVFALRWWELGAALVPREQRLKRTRCTHLQSV